ncbi:hypothetical protein [Natrinema sp. HArc-T2]|uniref:hypothetical protein n=1 Tax=Natrinema sp. HArc-T2 TaxID=3242701 RepID=UPI00359ED42A
MDQLKADGNRSVDKDGRIIKGSNDHIIEYQGLSGSEWVNQYTDLNEIPWRHLIRLAEEPKDGDYKEAKYVGGATAENVLKQFDQNLKASGTDLGRLLAAYLVASAETVWVIYYEAEQQGYFHEVGDVAFVSDHSPDSEPPEIDAIEW